MLVSPRRSYPESFSPIGEKFWNFFFGLGLKKKCVEKKTCSIQIFFGRTYIVYVVFLIYAFLNTKINFLLQKLRFLCFQRIDRRKLIRKSTFKNFLPLSKVGFMSDLVSQNESIHWSQPPAAKQPGVTREDQFFFKKFFFMKVPKSPETDEKNIFSRKKNFFWFSKKKRICKKKRKRIRFSLRQISRKDHLCV